MDPIHAEIGQIIRDHRKKLNMTQLDLAQKLGYDTVQFVSLFERGLAKVPSKIIGKLIVILGIPEKKIVKTIVDHYASDLNEDIRQGKKSVS